MNQENKDPDRPVTKIDLVEEYSDSEIDLVREYSELWEWCAAYDRGEEIPEVDITNEEMIAIIEKFDPDTITKEEMAAIFSDK